MCSWKHFNLLVSFIVLRRTSTEYFKFGLNYWTAQIFIYKVLTNRRLVRRIHPYIPRVLCGRTGCSGSCRHMDFSLKNKHWFTRTGKHPVLQYNIDKTLFEYQLINWFTVVWFFSPKYARGREIIVHRFTDSSSQFQLFFWDLFRHLQKNGPISS